MRNSHELLTNLSWKFAERLSSQLISTAVSIVLARILEPEHYGIISMVMIFIAIADILVSDGFGTALIQKKNASATDFFSVLYFNIAFSIALYFVLFLAAPMISNFYGTGYASLTPVLRVLGLRIILTATNSVQQAYISKHMMFRKFFIATFWGTLISALVGLAMALNNFGVWSLVAQNLVCSAVNTITLSILIRKRPQLLFSATALKNMFPYGARILGTGLLITGYQELRALIIGKIYSSSDLAYYDKGRNFPTLIVNNINASISAVLFPKMSNEPENIKSTMRNSIRFSSYLMCPLMLGLAAVANPFVSLLLTDKWLPCVPILQMFCIFFLFQPIHTANMQAIKALGRSDIYLKLEIIKKIIELVVLLSVMRISVNAIVVGMTACATAFTFVNAYPNIKLLNYGIKEQLADILPGISMAVVMSIAVYLIGYCNVVTYLKLIIQVVSGTIIYILMSVFTKNSEFKYLINIILSVFSKSNEVR